MINSKRIVIKLRGGKYQSFCKDKDFIVFAKMTKCRDGSTSLHFKDTVTFSNLPPDRWIFKSYIIK